MRRVYQFETVHYVVHITCNVFFLESHHFHSLVIAFFVHIVCSFEKKQQKNKFVLLCNAWPPMNY